MGFEKRQIRRDEQKDRGTNKEMPARDWCREIERRTYKWTDIIS